MKWLWFTLYRGMIRLKYPVLKLLYFTFDFLFSFFLFNLLFILLFTLLSSLFASCFFETLPSLVSVARAVFSSPWLEMTAQGKLFDPLIFPSPATFCLK